MKTNNGLINRNLISKRHDSIETTNKSVESQQRSSKLSRFQTIIKKDMETKLGSEIRTIGENDGSDENLYGVIDLSYFRFTKARNLISILMEVFNGQKYGSHSLSGMSILAIRLYVPWFFITLTLHSFITLFTESVFVMLAIRSFHCDFKS